MANEAGIELVLSAPNVKGVMDDVIESWKEISKREKEAKENADEYSMSVTIQLAKMKQMATENQKIKDAIAGLKNPIKENTDAIVDQGNEANTTSSIQKKGIIGVISEYLRQKKVLKDVKEGIVAVKNEIYLLDVRQRELGRSAKLTTDQYKEFEANKVKLAELGKGLKELQRDHKILDVNIKGTEGKYKGLLGALGGVKKASSLLFKGIAAGITLVALSFAAAIKTFSLINKVFQNDVVDNQFDKLKKKFTDLKFEIGAALAPIGLAISDSLGKLIDKVSQFLSDNQQAIFDWAVNAGGNIAGFAASLEGRIDKIGLQFKKLSAIIKINALGLEAATSGGLTLLSASKRKEFVDTQAEIDNLTKAIGDQTFANQYAFITAKIEFENMANAIGLAGTKVKNLTKEQIALIEKMREEYAKLTEEIQKQIEALDIKDAGPFFGVLLKAELAAKAIEKEGARAVFLAEKLGENQKRINEIRNDVARLAEAVRDDAVKFLTDQSSAILDDVNKKLRELKAKNAGSEDDLKLARELDEQLKKLQLASNISAALVKKARDEIKLAEEERRAVDQEIVDTATESLNQLNITAQGINEISSLIALDTFKKKSDEFFAELRDHTNKELAFLKAQEATLKTTLASLGDSPFSQEQRSEIHLSIKVNELDQAVAIEKIKQIENSFEIFKSTGVRGVIETDATIRLKVEQQLGGIQAIQAGTTEPPLPKEEKDGPSAVELLDATVQIYGLAYSTINQIVQDSVNAQIDALDLLIAKRSEESDDLRKILELEAQFKLAGLANDYDLVKKDLAQKEALEAAAVKKQNELKEKQIKLQRQQDSIQQASAISTAIANLFAQGSKLGPIGIAFALASIAAMLVSFVAFKLKAATIARAYKGSRRAGETYGTLAPGEGENDAPGHDRGLSVVDRHGRLRGFLGGDEVIVKESVSRKHRAALAFLNENEGQFKNIDLLKRLKGLDRSDYVPINYSRIIEKNNKLREKLIVVQAPGGISKKDLKEAVQDAMTEHAQKMIAYHESRPDRVPAGWLNDYYEMNSKSQRHIKSS